VFDAIKTFIADLAGGDRHGETFDDNDYRLAAAALLVHAATIDGSLGGVERDTLRLLLRGRFALDESGTDRLIAKATAAERDAVDLYHFTRLLNRSLDDAGRARVVEMMWQVAYADGHVSDSQANLIWRAADLLSVPSRERVALRQRVAAAHEDGAQ